MVYESDFYTSRRPYSRPTVSSYSVTRREVPWHKVPLVPRPSQVAPCFTVYGSRSVPNHGVKLPGLGKGQTFHRNIPSVGHRRLVLVTPISTHSVRSRPSVLISEMDRIHHKFRPHLAYQPTEDYLNSRSMVSFDDETRSIRAQTADLLRKIHTPVPRAHRPLPLPGEVEICCLDSDWYDWLDWYPEELGQTRLRAKLSSLKRELAELDTGAYYSHSELPITERITSDDYINRLLNGNKNVARDINIMSHYEDAGKHYNSIGRGHLACVSFAGNRPISKRRNLADDYIKDDITVLSHYGRFRAAAAAANVTEPGEEKTDLNQEYVPSGHRPPTKTPSGSWKSNAPRVPRESNKSGHLTAGEEYDAAQDRKQRRRDAVEAAAARECEEEKRRKGEVNRQDDLAKQALVDREQELERKAREEEEAAVRKQEEERLAAERHAKEEEERLLREEEERLAAEEQKLIEEEESRKRQEEEEKKSKKAKKEAEKKAKEEAERKAKEEEELKKQKEEEEKKAREEEERLKKEEEERKAKEEAERLAKEEAERLAAEEAAKAAAAAAEEAAKAAAAAEEAAKAAAEEEARIAAEAAAQAEPEAKVVEETAEVEQPVEEPAPEPVAEPVQASEEPVVEEPAEEAEPTPAPVADEVVSDEPEE